MTNNNQKKIIKHKISQYQINHKGTQSKNLEQGKMGWELDIIRDQVCVGGLELHDTWPTRGLK